MELTNQVSTKSTQPIQLELNGLLSGLFILWMVVASILSIIQSVMIFQLGIDNGIAIGIYNLLITILGISGTCGMYKKRRWGLFLIGIFFFIQFVFCLYLDNSVIGYSNEAIKVLIRLVILSALLCLRKDGHSAWETIWNNGILKPKVKDQSISSLSLDKATKDEKEHKEIEIKPASFEPESKPDENNISNNKKDKGHNKPWSKIPTPSKKLLIWIVISLLIVGSSVYAINIVVSISKQSYPEYIESFYSKMLYHYGKPNNALFRDLIYKAQAAHEADLQEMEQYYYQAAMDIGTDKDELLIKMGDYYYNSDNFSEALKLYQRVQNSEIEALREKMAWCYFKTGSFGDYDQAIQMSQSLLMQNPQNLSAIKTLYHVYWINRIGISVFYGLINTLI